MRVEIFDGSRKPEMFKLWIDLGEEVVQRAAQLGYNYTVKDVEGLKLLCLTDLGEIRISSFKSEVLTVGVPGQERNPVLVTPKKDVPKGGKLY